MNEARCRLRNSQPVTTGPVLYWMGREQRIADNWAMVEAARLANQMQQPLHVVFVLPAAFIGASMRQYDFLLRGLTEIAESLERIGVGFHLVCGDPAIEVPTLVANLQAGVLVTDLNPLCVVESWKQQVAEAITVQCIEVDAHNIVPVWVASPKAEYGARTIRPKIQAHLDEFLTDFPKLNVKVLVQTKKPDWDEAYQFCKANAAVPSVSWCVPGENAAKKAMRVFIAHSLHGYGTNRNAIHLDGQSGLSPYLHFGHLAPQRLAWEVSHADAPKEDIEAFLEELIIRRELADNFTFYTPHYDQLSAAPAWARDSLQKHVGDPRPYLYTYAQLERAETHDELWNAAQQQLLQTGKMHGYMRMYWAKQVALWTPDAETALSYVLKLNDTYSLDGNDPNGYVGALWSIAGLHDRPWFDRPVIGLIRSMGLAGVTRRGNPIQYLQQYSAKARYPKEH